MPKTRNAEMHNTESDINLVEAALKGDNAAFAELLQRYKNLVYSIILRMTNDPEESNDLAQEVFIKIYKNLYRYHPEYKFSTWVIRITTNHIIDYRRKQRQNTVNIEDSCVNVASEDNPENETIKKERNEQISSAIASLPDIYKAPILLYHKYNLSYQEIADILEIPLSKVKNRILRGRRTLKEILQKEGVKEK